MTHRPKMEPALTHPTLKAGDIVRNRRAEWCLLETPVHSGEWAFGGQRSFKARAVVTCFGRVEEVVMFLPESTVAA